MAWTPPTTAPFLAGHEPTTAELTAQVTNNFLAIGGAWTAYTPTWTAATTNPVIGNGTIDGAYAAAGKLIFYRIAIVGGTTTTWGSGAYSFTYPPFTPKDSGNPGNSGTTGFMYDTSANKPYCLIGIGNSSTTIRMLETSANSFMSHNYPIALPATGDEITFSGCYEAA
jgi:hypothetical protein